jgi:hypothetical protein
LKDESTPLAQRYDFVHEIFFCHNALLCFPAYMLKSFSAIAGLETENGDKYF